MGEGGVGHQGHRLAGEHSHAASRCPGKVLSENNILGGAALHQPRAPGSRQWKMSDGSWRSLPRGQGFRHGRVSPIIYIYIFISQSSFFFEFVPFESCIIFTIINPRIESPCLFSFNIFFSFMFIFVFFCSRLKIEYFS